MTITSPRSGDGADGICSVFPRSNRAVSVALATLLGFSSGATQADTSCYAQFKGLREWAKQKDGLIDVHWTTNYYTSNARFMATSVVKLRLHDRDLVGEGTRRYSGQAGKVEDVSLRIRGDDRIVFQEAYGPYSARCSGHPLAPFAIVDSNDSLEAMHFLRRIEREELRWVSEETAPAICPAGYALSALTCSGSYCDNIGARCTRYADPPAVSSPEPTYWTSWHSEEKDGDVLEGSNFPMLAHPNSVAVGLRCRGKYCDNISLLIQPLRGANVPTLDSKEGQQCRLSPPFSEEGNPPQPQTSSAFKEMIRRVGCSGSYCDNLRIEWCKVFKP
jgi:hypothetical protein